MPKANCQFRGSGGQYFVTVIFHLIILGTLTFGIYSAWAWVRLLKLKASHTTMNGKSVSFTGTGGQLFVLGLIQGLLSLITLGLYSPWAVCAIFRWIAQNTLVEGKPSTFTGTGGSLFLLYLIHFIILPILTLGLYYFWGMRRFFGWKEEHTRYGGERTSFGAGVGGFIAVYLVGNFLTAITVYLFSPWAFNMFFKWQVQGLAVGDDNQVQHFPPARTGFVTVACLIVIGLGTVAGFGYLGMNQFQNIAKNLPQKAAPRIDAGQKRTYKIPAPKPPATPPQKRPTKRPTKRVVKVAPSRAPATRPPEVEPEVPKKTVNYEVEMNRVGKLLKLDKKNQNALYNRAWLHAYKGNFALAEKDYSLAIATNRKLEDAYFNRGLALIKLRKFGEAVNDFTKVTKMNPASTDAFCNRGNAYFKLGKKGLALTDYNTALEIDPKDADIYYNRASLHRSRGQEDAAMADFKRAAALGQDKARKYLNLPPARPKTTPRTSIAKRKLKPANVNMSSGDASGNASGTIHGAKFRVEKATLANGILTLRQGKDFFPDQAVMIFLFLKDGEAIEGKSYDVSRDQGFGSPHIHMKWKEEGENLPKTQIYMKDYIMRLEFGRKRNGTLAGKITLALPDEHQSEVNGTFRAELK